MGLYENQSWAGLRGSMIHTSGANGGGILLSAFLFKPSRFILIHFHPHFYALFPGIMHRS